nr:ABC transporter permease [uncultured Agathobaculum sp.]
MADLFCLAVGNLRENPLRTALCALSVAVGSGALLLIAAIGLFGQTQLQAALRTIGVSGLTVYLDGHGAGNALSAELANTMEQAITGIDSVMPIKAATGTVRAGHAIENAVFLGADERLGKVMHLEVQAGTLMTAQQAEAAEAVAVVGDELAQRLYGRTNIVGREIRLHLNGRDQYFTVCGVVKSQTGALGSAISSFAPHLVYVPYACLASQQQNADQVFVQCTAESDLDTVSDQIETYLTRRGQVDGTVRVQNMTGMVETIEGMAQLFIAVFLAVGAITLGVALIGVLCSMLAATHEKTEEIGILLAIGAQPRDIRRLFLLQSGLLCMIGGLCGLALASGAIYFFTSMLLDWRIVTSLLVLSVVCGAAAGLLPAVRAARLDPIDAMRN